MNSNGLCGRLVCLVLGAGLALAPTAHADEALGRQLTRKAQAALTEGNVARAQELIERARVEWPGAPEVAHTLGDVRYRQGDFSGAMAEYDKGSAEPHAFRAFFNQGVVLNERSEKGLAEAAVPLDPAGIPADVVPGPMIAAIEKALPGLEASRGRFLEALTRESDGDARESVAALNKRMDDLREMKEELERIQEEQNEDEEGEDEQEGEDGEEEGDPSEEGDESEEGEGEGENDDSEPQEDPQDRQQEGENPDSQESDEQPAEDEPTPSEPADPQAAEPRSLSPEDVSKLLEQLEALEAKAMALERARRVARRQSVEKDW